MVIKYILRSRRKNLVCITGQTCHCHPLRRSAAIAGHTLYYKKTCIRTVFRYIWQQPQLWFTKRDRRHPFDPGVAGRSCSLLRKPVDHDPEVKWERRREDNPNIALIVKSFYTSLLLEISSWTVKRIAPIREDWNTYQKYNIPNPFQTLDGCRRTSRLRLAAATAKESKNKRFRTTCQIWQTGVERRGVVINLAPA